VSIQKKEIQTGSKITVMMTRALFTCAPHPLNIKLAAYASPFSINKVPLPKSRETKDSIVPLRPYDVAKQKMLINMPPMPTPASNRGSSEFPTKIMFI
jgi:hypothetical protein